MPTPVITPNMSLTEPTVGGTLSPTWAQYLNDNFGTIDQHNHTPGMGVQIPPAGLNINTDLSFQGNNLIALNSAVFNGAISGTPSLLSIYSNGTDLYYKDINGHQIQLTKAGSPNAGTGNIQGLPSTPTGGAGISWVNGIGGLPGTFQMLLDSGTAGATVDMGSLILRYPGAYPSPSGNYIALQAPTSLATGYPLTLPASLPSSNSALTETSTSGSQSFLSLGAASTVLRVNSGGTGLEYNTVDTVNITPGAITTATIASGAVAPGNITNPLVRNTSFGPTIGATSVGLVLSGSFPVSGTTVTKFLIQGVGTDSYLRLTTVGNSYPSTTVAQVKLAIDGTFVQNWTFQSNYNLGAFAEGFITSWPMSLYYVYPSILSAGTHTYAIYFGLETGNAGCSADMGAAVILIMEL